MNDQIDQIAERLRGLRDVLELTSEDIPRDSDIPAEEYRLAETGEYDISVSMLQKIARTDVYKRQGYTAGELIRLLLNHPKTEIVFINSSRNAGNRSTDVHEGLYGETDLRFTDQLPLDEIDVLFFCTAHGDTKMCIRDRY